MTTSRVFSGISSTCLSAEREHGGRATSAVTGVGPAGKDDWTDELQVSPHLIIWTRIDLCVVAAEAIRAGRERLDSIYAWMERGAR